MRKRTSVDVVGVARDAVDRSQGTGALKLRHNSCSSSRMSKAWCAGAPALILFAIAAAACGSGASASSMEAGGSTSGGCTLIGCEDGASITLQTATGSWSAGAYNLDVNADGATSTCALQIPEMPSETSPLSASCTTRTSLTFMSVTRCVTIDAGDGVSGGECRPVPGQFTMLLALPGTPQDVSLAVTRDGLPLASDSLTLSYQSFYPNGPSCGGPCRQASTKLTVSAAGTGGVSSDSGPAPTDAGGQDN